MSQAMRTARVTWGTPMSMPFGTDGTTEVLEALADHFECENAESDDGDIKELYITEGERFLDNLKLRESEALAAYLFRNYHLREARETLPDHEGSLINTLVLFLDELKAIIPQWEQELDDGDLRIYLD